MVFSSCLQSHFVLLADTTISHEQIVWTYPNYLLNGYKARLEFLMFALTNSSLSLSESHVDLLWRVLVEDALSPEAAGECVVPCSPSNELFEARDVGKNKSCASIILTLFMKGPSCSPRLLYEYGKRTYY